MIPLVLTICLLSDPSVCREEKPPIDLTPVQCTIMGQMAAQEYLADHPKWTLRGWRCGPDQRPS